MISMQEMQYMNVLISNPESIPGSTSNVNGALFYFVQGTCTGLPCPPYVNNRVITCVVCTK